MDPIYQITLGAVIWIVASILINTYENKEQIYRYVFLAVVLVGVFFIFVLPQYQSFPINLIGGGILVQLVKNFFARKMLEKKLREEQKNAETIEKMENKLSAMSENRNGK